VINMIKGTTPARITIPKVLSRYLHKNQDGRVEIRLPSLIGQIPLLTESREDVFQAGMFVAEERLEGPAPVVSFFPAHFGETVLCRPSDLETLQAYNAWRAETYSDQRISANQLKRLEEKCQRHGLSIENAEQLSTEAAEIFDAVLEMLPASLLQSGRDYLSGFYFFSGRKLQHRISAYVDAKIWLYPFVLDYYWKSPGIILHELGHTTVTRLEGDIEKATFGPDQTIPEAAKQAFAGALNDLMPDLEKFLVNYIVPEKIRISGFNMNRSELVADLNVMYFYNGAAIRDYINSGSRSSGAVAWRTAYNFLKDYVFDGMEYSRE
jgi:hypothetical protein